MIADNDGDAVCTQCFRQKPIEKFPLCGGWASGRSPRCSACRNSGEVWPSVVDVAVLHVCGVPLDEKAHATLKEVALEVSEGAAEGFPRVSRADIFPLVFRTIQWRTPAMSGVEGALKTVAEFASRAHRVAKSIELTRQEEESEKQAWAGVYTVRNLDV